MTEEVLTGKLETLYYNGRRAIMRVEDPTVKCRWRTFDFPEMLTEKMRELWGKRVTVSIAGNEAQGIVAYSKVTPPLLFGEHTKQKGETR